MRLPERQTASCSTWISQRQDSGTAHSSALPMKMVLCRTAQYDVDRGMLADGDLHLACIEAFLASSDRRGGYS